jgi:hypothetical protein
MKTNCSTIVYRSIKTAGLVMAVLLLTTTNSFAGKGKTNFTGKWSLNESKSTLSPEGRGPAKMLNITQEGNNLNVERTQTNRDGQETTISLKYTLDGKECDNSNDRRTSKSVLTWSSDGKALTINTTSTSERDGQTFEYKSTEVWKYSEDGKSLFIDQVVNSSRGERKSILIYEKK